eukprot:ctg_2165.g422
MDIVLLLVVTVFSFAGHFFEERRAGGFSPRPPDAVHGAPPRLDPAGAKAATCGRGGRTGRCDRQRAVAPAGHGEERAPGGSGALLPTHPGHAAATGARIGRRCAVPRYPAGGDRCRHQLVHLFRHLRDGQVVADGRTSPSICSDDDDDDISEPAADGRAQHDPHAGGCQRQHRLVDHLRAQGGAQAAPSGRARGHRLASVAASALARPVLGIPGDAVAQRAHHGVEFRLLRGAEDSPGAAAAPVAGASERSARSIARARYAARGGAAVGGQYGRRTVLGADHAAGRGQDQIQHRHLGAPLVAERAGHAATRAAAGGAGRAVSRAAPARWPSRPENAAGVLSAARSADARIIAIIVTSAHRVSASLACAWASSSTRMLDSACCATCTSLSPSPPPAAGARKSRARRRAPGAPRRTVAGCQRWAPSRRSSPPGATAARSPACATAGVAVDRFAVGKPSRREPRPNPGTTGAVMASGASSARTSGTRDTGASVELQRRWRRGALRSEQLAWKAALDIREERSRHRLRCCRSRSAEETGKTRAGGIHR